MLSARITLVTICLAALPACRPAQPDPLAAFPPIIVWAWERPEDLRFLHPDQTGVAFLAGTVTLQPGDVLLLPRRQPLLTAPGVKLLAVFRMEGSITPTDPAPIAQWIIRTAAMPGVAGLQIDFDATPSQRRFYRALLEQLRSLLPRSQPLTITALVSWCHGDNHWLRGAPVADAVPMYFRMGPENYLRGRETREPLCSQSTGLSTDELLPIRKHRRVFLFNPKPWTETAFNHALGEISQW